MRKETRESNAKLRKLSKARAAGVQCPNSLCPLRHYFWADGEEKVRRPLRVCCCVADQLLTGPEGA